MKVLLEREVVRQRSRHLRAADRLAHVVKERRQLEWESLQLFAEVDSLPIQTNHEVRKDRTEW